MEEKTEQLRDIFMEVADEKSVTETQAEQRGSLVPTGSVDDRLADAVERMRERFDFGTDLDGAELVAVVKRFYDGEDDTDIADALGASPEAVFTARMDLHLVGDDEVGLDLSAARDRLDADESDAAVAEALGVDAGEVARARRVRTAQREARLVSHRFRTEFEEILTDADIAVRFTADAQEDGLEEAAEDIETDVDF
jgi:hypothetical protein